MIQFDINKHRLDYEFNYNTKETTNLKDFFSQIRQKRNLLVDDLRRVALWKLDRVLEIPDDLLEKLDYLAKESDISIYDEEVKNIIVQLTKCKGVGYPMASTILKFIRPDIFPIIDVRAYRAVFGKKLYSYQYSIDVYYNYAEEVYKISQKLKISVDQVDEQLYVFDKKYNGKI